MKLIEYIYKYLHCYTTLKSIINDSIKVKYLNNIYNFYYLFTKNHTERGDTFIKINNKNILICCDGCFYYIYIDGNYYKKVLYLVLNEELKYQILNKVGYYS